jgi:hypothetical protein
MIRTGPRSPVAGARALGWVRAGLIAVVALAMLLVTPPSQAAGERRIELRRWPGEIDVMTQNQYLGADFSSLSAAGSREELDAAVVDLLRQIAANYFPRRADRQATEIVRRRLDLIGLQEVQYLFCQDLPPAPGACADPSIARAFGDQLEAMLSALRDRGANYQVAASVVNMDLRDLQVTVPGIGKLRGLPFSINGKNALLTGYDRNVILQRPGVEARPVAFPRCRRSAEGCSFEAATSLPLPALGEKVAVPLKQGFVGVDASVRGIGFRFVTTRLESSTEAGDVQAAQAAELLAALDGAALMELRGPIVAGDFGAAPSGAESAEARFEAGGYIDAWKNRKGAAPGPTCCQDPDLRNQASQLSERADFIFVKEPLRVGQVRLVGTEPADKTWPLDGQRLWPADHAGLAARITARQQAPEPE